MIEPAGLVAVAAALERAMAGGSRVDFRGPENTVVRQQLAETGLGDEMSRLGISHNLATPMADGRRDRLGKLRRFENEHELEEVAAALLHLSVRHHGELSQALYLSLFELGVNAIGHSGRKAGYVALERFPEVGQIAFSVADSGIGLREKLGAASDEAALRLAARKYATTEPAPGRGHGITSVVESTGRHRGAVTLFSGTAHGLFTNGGWDPRVTPASHPFEGTVAEVRLAQDGRLRS